jgi:hypothetical protein
MSPTRKLALLVSFGLAAAAACAACGGGSTGGNTTGGGSTTSSGTTSTSTGAQTTSSGTTSTSTGSNTTSTSTGTATQPQPPSFETLKPNNGGLQLTWTEPSPCDNIEVSRKDALDPYAVLATVPGTMLSYQDATATGNFNYTYRLRCETAGVFSDYSGELSANPTVGP